MIQVVRLERGKPDHDLFLPLALRRVHGFCKVADVDADPEMLVANVVHDFVNDKQIFYLAVGVDDGQLVGHVLACLDRYYKLQIVTIVQYQLDYGIDQEILKPAFEMVRDWGNENGAVEMRAVVPNDAHARRLAIFYGFESHRLVQRRKI